MWPFKRRVHRHTAARWDGYYEHCRCGAWSGDVRDARGNRSISFDDWPKEAA